MLWKGRLICEAAFFVFLTRDWNWNHYFPCVMAEGHPSSPVCEGISLALRRLRIKSAMTARGESGLQVSNVKRIEHICLPKTP